MKPARSEQKLVVLGRISGLHGVRGWLKIYSYSRPRENIFSYSPWLLEDTPGLLVSKKVLAWKRQGKGLVAELEGVNDRELASPYVGLDIAVLRSQLPALAKDEYYWCDLIGLEVINQNRDSLGTITEIRETGANDVLVVEGEQKYLIPMLKESVVKQVDQDNRLMLVDWDGEYI